MKALLFTAAAILATLNMYGQGQGVINFGNVNTTDDRRIWVNHTGVVGGGTRAAGTGYKIALYYSPSTTATAAELIQIGSAANFALGNGQFAGGNRTVATVGANGDPVTVQARAWTTLAGVPDTYEAVLAAGMAGDSRAMVGSGPVFVDDTYRPGDPTDPPTAIGTHAGWRGFALGIPEPSVIGLSLLGVGALLMLRRRSVINKLTSNIRG